MMFLDMFVTMLGHQNVQFKDIGKNMDVILKYYLKMTLKKASDEGLTDFNHVAIDGTVKKAYNSNNNTISKKETQILIDYYEGRPTNPETLEELHKPAQRIYDNENIDVEDKL